LRDYYAFYRILICHQTNNLPFLCVLWTSRYTLALNLALGNRDNHGRNTAILKDIDGSIRLAPLYDFGPAFLDARALVRVIYWDGEEAGQRHWDRILRNLATRFEDAGLACDSLPRLTETLQMFARELDGLPRRMAECGVASHVIEHRVSEIEQLASELRATKGL
jgi:serine/threonine-protein kinase HipA